MNNNLWIRSKKHDCISNYSRNSSWWLRVYNCLSRNVTSPFFSLIPIVSIYYNVTQAIGILSKQEPEHHDELDYTHLKANEGKFTDFFKVTQKVYRVKEPVDEVRLEKRNSPYEWDDINHQMDVRHGYRIKLLSAGNIISDTDTTSELSEIKKGLDLMVRKRLAIFVFIFAVAAVLVGVLK